MRRIILGPDAMSARRARDAFVAAHDPSGLAVDRFESSTPASAVRSALATVGFFGAGRVVVVTGLIERLQRELGNRKPTGGEPEILIDILSSSGDNALLLYEPTLERLHVWLRSALGAHVEVEEHPIARGRDLIAWVKREAAGAGSSIDDVAAQRLLDRAAPGRWRESNRNPAYDQPPDLMALSTELAKLANYADGEIRPSDVETMVAQSDEDRMFPLIDAVAGGDSPAALREIATLEGDDEAARAFHQLMTTVELAAVADGAVCGSNLPEVARELGLKNPNRLTQVARKPRTVTTAQAAASDRLVKSGKLDDQSAALVWLTIQARRGPR